MIKFNKKIGNVNYFACSGGIDSIVFAHFLSKNKNKPIIVHFNHKLLLEDDIFESSVKKFCDDFSFKLIVKETKEKYKKGSVEEWCRRVRYEYLYSLKGNVATGHHLNDVVENYLFNCIRGYHEHLPIPLNTNNIIRPFLLTNKETIKRYSDKYNLSKYVVEDPLNNELSKTRNWIRKVVAPEINGRFNLEKVVKKMYLKLS